MREDTELILGRIGQLERFMVAELGNMKDDISECQEDQKSLAKKVYVISGVVGSALGAGASKVIALAGL